MSEKFNIGACRLLVSSNIENPLGEWTDLGMTRGETTVTINEGEFGFGRADQIGVTPLADSVYLLGQSAQVSFNLLDEQKDILVEVAGKAVKEENGGLSSVGFGSEQGFITPVALCLVPVFDFDETDVRGFWKSEFAHWFRKVYFNITGNFVYNLPEGDDVLSDKAIEIQAMQVIDENTYGGGIGSVFLLSDPINIMGVDSQAQLSVAVPDSDLQTALQGASMQTVKDMVDNTTAFASTGGTIADATGIEFLVQTTNIDLGTNAITSIPSLKHFTHLTNLDLAGNNISEEDLSNLIDELWKIRSQLGSNSCVIAVESNNGLSQKAQDQIAGTTGTRYAGDGLVDAGCTVTS